MSLGPKFDVFFEAYIECALWSTKDNSDESGGSSLDDNYGKDDIAARTLAQMEKDCIEFWTEHRAVLADNPSQAGHDFWLTREGHGSGFWDGKWPEPLGSELTKASKAYGNFYLYVGDNGKIYD